MALAEKDTSQRTPLLRTPIDAHRIAIQDDIDVIKTFSKELEFAADQVLSDRRTLIELDKRRQKLREASRYN